MVDRIGDTPLVLLQRLPRGLVKPGVEVWVKLESFNPGGSVKDRAAWSILQDAEQGGRIGPDTWLLDASSGNTGIAYGMLAAARGHRVRLCVPESVSRERKVLLRALGVDVRFTDAAAGSDGAIRAARELAAEDPRHLYLDQYSNPANWRAHVNGTAAELWRDSGGRITHWVAGLGTTGTFVGTSRGLRARAPHVRCIALQPAVADHGLDGLKHLPTACVPAIWDPHVAHERIEVPTAPSLELVRRLAREEGILTGPSGGAAVWGALEVARRLDRGVVCTLLPDGAERYLSDTRLWG